VDLCEILSTWYLRGEFVPQGIIGPNGLDMNLRLASERLPSSRSRRGIDVRRWVTGIASSAVVLASGIIGMAPASAAPCAGESLAGGTYTLTLLSDCEWTPPALVTWADVVVVGGGGGGSGSYGDTTSGANTLLAGNGGGGGNIAFSTRVVVVPGTAINATIGAGGTAGAAGGAGVGGDGGGLRPSAVCLLQAARVARPPAQRPLQSRRVAVRV
jgi:hypothetical protein